MEYYDPKEHIPRYYAAAITFVVLAAVAYLVGLITITIEPKPKDDTTSVVEFVAEEVVEEQPKPKIKQSSPSDVRHSKAPAHVEEAPKEQMQQAQGEEVKTETLNPNALFNPTLGNVPDELPEGNRLAPDGEKESRSGEGQGYNLEGTDQLDAGLKGRGLREGLPRPNLGYNTDGTVVVYVTIDSKGNVTSAEVRDKGTTTQDATLRRLAREAALKAKFNASSKLSEGGYITYKFKLH